MIQKIQIRCKNNKKTANFNIGSSISDIFDAFELKMDYGPICAKVNNVVEGMHCRIYQDADIEFLDMYSSAGVRTYTRTLFFILCKAVYDLYPNGHVIIDIPVSNGYYCDLRIGRAVTLHDVDQIRGRMNEIIAQALPIKRYQAPTEEARQIFEKRKATSKVKLLEQQGKIYTTYYDIDGYADYYYGSLLTNTSQAYLFGLEKYYDGLLLRIPSYQNPAVLGELIKQDKMFEIFQEHHKWQNILDVRTVGDFNELITTGKANELINISEALQEKKIARIADEIASRKGIKIVLIAGPSSSGKTTMCKRLSIQLLTNGIRPVGLSLDDYFVDREDTPRDASGDYDFEHLHSLNIPLLNQQLEALISGEEVELPKYDFKTGSSEMSGKRMKLDANEVLVVEGIHALNPELTAQIPEELKFRVYASALTTILLDTHNYIPTTDNRLLRRIIRDHKYRGISARETIRRWPSVRAGENRWIFPFQENADAMFNTAMLYELAVIKAQAEPLLDDVPENCPEYSEAHRLSQFLKYFHTVPNLQIPPTSLLREFLGGSSFKY